LGYPINDDIEDVVASGLGAPRGMALDERAERIYWSDIETNKIQRSALDGSLVEDVV